MSAQPLPDLNLRPGLALPPTFKLTHGLSKAAFSRRILGISVIFPVCSRPCTTQKLRPHLTPSYKMLSLPQNWSQFLDLQSYKHSCVSVRPQSALRVCPMSYRPDEDTGSMELELWSGRYYVGAGNRTQSSARDQPPQKLGGPLKISISKKRKTDGTSHWAGLKIRNRKTFSEFGVRTAVPKVWTPVKAVTKKTRGALYYTCS